MEKGNTKQQILEAALELFSVNGFEATSTAQIAEAVGIRKASLYSHFENKQAILDTLISGVLEQYNRHSMFALANWEDPAYTADKQHMDSEQMCRLVMEQMTFILHEPHIKKTRKLLVIEQFRNPELAALHSKQTYEDVMNYSLGLVRFLGRQQILVQGEPEIMAAQLCLPITAWINLCDREPEREQEILTMMEHHILRFFRINRAPEPAAE